MDANKAARGCLIAWVAWMLLIIGGGALMMLFSIWQALSGSTKTWVNGVPTAYHKPQEAIPTLGFLMLWLSFGAIMLLITHLGSQSMAKTPWQDTGSALTYRSGNRVFALPVLFAGIGILTFTVGGILFDPNFQVNNRPASLEDISGVASIVAPLTLLIVWALLAYTNEWTLDYVRRTYRIRRGFVPWAAIQEGSLDELEGLQLTRELRQSSSH